MAHCHLEVKGYLSLKCTVIVLLTHVEGPSAPEHGNNLVMGNSHIGVRTTKPSFAIFASL